MWRVTWLPGVIRREWRGMNLAQPCKANWCKLSYPCYLCTVGWPFHPISKLWQPNLSAKSAWQTPQISQHLWHHITLQNFNISKIDPMWCRRLRSSIPQQLSEIGPINFPCTYNTTSISHGSGMGSKEVHLQSCKPSQTQCGTKNKYLVKFDRLTDVYEVESTNHFSNLLGSHSMPATCHPHQVPQSLL